MLVKLGKPETEMHSLAEFRTAAIEAHLATAVKSYDRSTLSTDEGEKIMTFDVLSLIESKLPKVGP